MISGLNKIVLSNGLGYFMSPYTKHPTELDKYCDLTAAACSILHEAGLVLIAPIVQGHPMWKYMPDNKYTRSHEMWMPICERIFMRCDYGVVCMLEGWDQSMGMALEVFIMSSGGKQVLFFDPSLLVLRTMQEMYDACPIEMGEMIKNAAANLGKVPSMHLRAKDQGKTYVDTVLGLAAQQGQQLNG